MSNPSSLNDLLETNGLNLQTVGFARHPYNKRVVRQLFEQYCMDESTALQLKGRLDKYDYIISLLGFPDGKCLFLSGYKIAGWEQDAGKYMKRYPFRDHITEATVFYRLEPLQFLTPYKNKLIIDWGPGARVWLQNGTKVKPIVRFSSLPIDPKDYIKGI
jgi:hypothetical protein